METRRRRRDDVLDARAPWVKRDLTQRAVPRRAGCGAGKMRVLMFLVVLLTWTHADASERGVALVIGNGAYQHVPALRTARQDGADMGEWLTSLGFETIIGLDLSLAEMQARTQEFAGKLEGAAVKLLYLSGHGVQIDGENIFLPTDFDLSEPPRIAEKTLVVGRLVSRMQKTPGINIVLLDIGRSNPFSAPVQLPESGEGASGANSGTMMVFATAPGQVAFDGEGRNSPFTTGLLKHLAIPGKDLQEALIAIRSEVFAATAGQQTPWSNSSIIGPVVLVPKTD